MIFNFSQHFFNYPWGIIVFIFPANGMNLGSYPFFLISKINNMDQLEYNALPNIWTRQKIFEIQNFLLMPNQLL